MINPALYTHAFPHGLGLLVIRKVPALCPLCGWRQVLWMSLPPELGELDACLACSSKALKEPRS